jgi:hypothetical protein
MPRYAPITASADGAYSSKRERTFHRNHDKLGPLKLGWSYFLLHFWFYKKFLSQ